MSPTNSGYTLHHSAGTPAAAVVVAQTLAQEASSAEADAAGRDRGASAAAAHADIEEDEHDEK